MVKVRANRIKYSDNESSGLRAKWKRLLLAHRGGCEVCGIDKWSMLTIHHKVYRPVIEMSDISLLCWKHHKLLHSFVSASDRDLPRFTDIFIQGYRDELDAR